MAHRWIPLKWPGREFDYGVQVVGADFDSQFQHSEGFRGLAKLQQTTTVIAGRPQISLIQTMDGSLRTTTVLPDIACTVPRGRSATS